MLPSDISSVNLWIFPFNLDETELRNFMVGILFWKAATYTAHVVLPLGFDSNTKLLL